ncbi:MAG: methionine synthase, partial [Candidatus Eisenbacteria bacterium]|nr:methionine synthase [Candidatus Eisenbacteria bacterium]
NNDLLSLTQPELISRIYQTYLEAGADIISTNTFNATSISQSDYGTESCAHEMNLIAARLARIAADAATRQDPSKPRFVAGSLGPTNRSGSISPDVNDPGFRNITFDELKLSYREQAAGLMAGGVDILLVETIFDTLNGKAAIAAIRELLKEQGSDLPVWISGTLADTAGRNLIGQTVEAFWYSIRHAEPFCVGLNCSFGAKALRPHLQELSRICDTLVTVHPNAGLPNELGGYDESPEEMAERLREFAEDGLVNIVGGCCGSTPDHIKAIAAAVNGIRPRDIPLVDRSCRLSGLEPLNIRPDSLFVNIGERTNVAGSSRFARLIRFGKFEEALDVGRRQVQNGAQLIDVNMDDAAIEAVPAMVKFLQLVASDPEIARVPIMIDSSRWEVIEAGLKCLQGKGVVNSISLKDGEEEFLRRAGIVRLYGAAVIVMSFDEKGQADTLQRKMETCRRAYTLLTSKIQFPPEDIIFDPNIFAVATGMKEHNNYALAYLEACRQIKQEFPHGLISGGVSNLSFSFRGNDTVREAMHSVFLYHAVNAGMDMGIVNAGQLAVYAEIDPELRSAVEDVILNRRPDATERLTALAIRTESKVKEDPADPTWRREGTTSRISHALVNGITEYIAEDALEAMKELESPLAVIEGPLMNGMNEVGELFGSGKMFLPQVIRSARVMKLAVDVLAPYLEVEKQLGDSPVRGKILLATVKGDVHDIGKNIVGVVLGCNNYKIIDLGVMTPVEEILETALREKVDLIGISGLISPSLNEMIHVAGEMQRRGLKTPLLIGGATTSRVHTAVKIDPVYDGAVVHVTDASRAVTVAGDLLHTSTAMETIRKTKKAYRELREKRERDDSKGTLLPIEVARSRCTPVKWRAYKPPIPKIAGIQVFKDDPLEGLIHFIDWSPFFRAWKLQGRYPQIFDSEKYGEEAKRLFNDSLGLLHRIAKDGWLEARAVAGIFPANAIGDDIVIYNDENRSEIRMVMHHLRRQTEGAQAGSNRCLSDFIAPAKTGIPDFVGAFVVSAGFGVPKAIQALTDGHDDYREIIIKALADRLAEAYAEFLHARIRREIWGYAPDEVLQSEEMIAEKYRGIRPAPGYPACPDHTEKETLFRLLKAQENIGVELTENFSMNPAASVSGWYFSHPDSHNFSVGMIGIDQVRDYAKRKGISVEECEHWLEPNLGYHSAR